MAKVPPFHTDTVEPYEAAEKWRYHDNDQCGYGKRIKDDGNDIAGTDNRSRCARCDTLAAEEAAA